MRHPLLCLALVLVTCALGACQEPGSSSQQASAPSKARAAEIRDAKAGPVDELVRAELHLANREGRRLVVYVGASWCEPCEYFQKAVKGGQLPEEFADLRFLKFDNDVDDERLSAAGFGGQMIPRFVRPKKDGTASEARFEGSIKGPGAVDNIVPKLRKLIY